MSSRLWNREVEKSFFLKALKDKFASIEDLFYKFDNEYYAYIKKKQKNNGQTLQGRNSLIGRYTEIWCQELLQPLVNEMKLYVVKDVICPEIGLPVQSGADIAVCTSEDRIQQPENIRMIIEVKMSIVNNYQFISNSNIRWVGDYKSHKGNPSFLRSDSMLKAIGKSINIRVSGFESTKIPIIILGNSPISNFYEKKVDDLKKFGVIQGFYSLYPNPVNSDFIFKTKNEGFVTIKNYESLKKTIIKLLESDLNYFSSMLPVNKLGKIIKLSALKKTDEDRAKKFLSLLRDAK